MSAAIQADNLCFTIQDRAILKNVSLVVERGEFVGIIGPNGSGKSTLLKNIYRVYTPTGGTIRLYGAAHTDMTNRQAANKVAVVAQETAVNFDFTAEEVVAMGRYPKKKLLDTLDRRDKEIINEAIRAVEMQNFAGRGFLSLSGGEKQRILIARALAQQTDTIILDEPTNHLDIGSRLSTLRLIRSSGKTVLAALHDLDTAANYCDKIYVLHGGRILCSGPPPELITPELIHTLYGVNADIFERNNKVFVDYH